MVGFQTFPARFQTFPAGYMEPISRRFRIRSETWQILTTWSRKTKKTKVENFLCYLLGPFFRFCSIRSWGYLGVRNSVCPVRGSNQRKSTREGFGGLLRVSDCHLGTSFPCKSPKKSLTEPKKRKRKTKKNKRKFIFLYFSLFFFIFLWFDPRCSWLCLACWIQR